MFCAMPQSSTFRRLLSCSAYRQIARDLGVSPTTVLRQVERLGRHCLLFHERLRPKQALGEPLVVDGFESFEFSQYTPVHFHTAVGAASHYVYGFTDSELRRKGRMTKRQQQRRAQLELRFGRPDPRSIEREMAALVEVVVPAGTAVAIHSDDHPAYPRAFARLRDQRITHLTTRSTVARTPHNPLFPVNLLDLLIRHSSANHKRETIAFSKRRQSAAERLFVLVVWRNYLKSFSERKRDATPAQRLGILERRLEVDEVLAARLFPKRIVLPDRWVLYYWRLTPTRRIPNGRVHALRYAA
jgi:DNA-binding Lrp family transcriptional regulator